LGFFLLGKITSERIEEEGLEFNKLEKQHLILKSIFKNLNFFISARWNAFIKLNSLEAYNYRVKLNSRYLNNINKKDLTN
jgi:hypothetical protein